MSSFIQFPSILSEICSGQAFIAKIKKGGNSIKTGNNVEVLAFYTFSDGLLLIYQVSFDYLLYFQRYALGKRFISNIRKASNSVNTGDRVMVLALCNFPHDPLSVY